MDCYQLQTISSFSFGKSSIQVDKYADRLFKLGYQGGGIADVNSMASFPYFDQAINNKSITPVYGMIISIMDNDVEFSGELVILNEQGYLNLVKIINLHKDIYALSDLSTRSEGLSFILKTEDERMKDASFLSSHNSFFYELSHIFPHFYFGIEIYSALDQSSIKNTRDFISNHSYMSLAFPKVIYLDREDNFKSYLMLQAIYEKKTITDEDLNDKGPFFLLSPNAMKKVYSSEEISNQSSLTKLIHFTFMKKRGKVLSSGEKDPKSALKEKSEEGLKNKLGGVIPPNYQERLDYELSVIDRMNFNDYFLLVEDYVDYSKKAGIKVGPGRGSAAGSLVSYSLNITEIDPIKYGLYFERFLNPLRVTMPDIDIDFEDDRRQDVINYLRTKYGASRVALIVTYSTLQMRASIRSIGTIFSLPESRIDALSKTISAKSNSFEQEYATNYRFKKMANDPYFKDVISKAKLVLNYPINTSIHASGVILSDDPLDEEIPIIKGETTNIAGFEYNILEQMGFLKMDILSLNYLSFISQIEKEIVNKGEKLPDISHDLKNKAAYDVLNNLLMSNIFQLESDGIKKTVGLIKPQSIDDISAVIALYRPGPMENIPTYAARKNSGAKYTPIIPQLNDILSDTYGIIIYQEQILTIAKKLAGFDGGKADLFRRAIAKKDISKMEALHSDFISGCINNNIDRNKAQEIYDLIKKFADYGFNKSHSYAYSFITYSLAYYKANYPWAFYLASFKNSSLGDEKATNLIKELYSFSYTLKNPSINKSGKDVIFENHSLILGLNQVKGINDRISLPILEERKKGPFTSLGDFFIRVDLTSISSRDLMSLIDAGCFDEFGFSREGLKEHLDDLKMVFKFSTDLSSMPYMEKTKDVKTVDEFMAEYMVLGSVISMSLSDLIKGEKKYSSLFLILDTPSYINNSTRLEVCDGFTKKSLYYDGKVDASKYDIISANEDRSRKNFSLALALNKEEKK